MWELSTKELPFSELSALHAAYYIAKNKRPHIPDDIHPRRRALISRLWHALPQARPSFSDILVLLPSCI